MGFGDVSVLVKVAFISIIVGFVVYLVGFASPYWSSSRAVLGKYHAGLWQACWNDCGEYGTVPDWLGAARAFGVIGFLTGLAAIVLCSLYIFLSQASNKLVYIITYVCCFATAGCALLSVLIYGAETIGLDWAWGFTIVAMLIYNVAGVLLVADAKG